MTYINFDKTYSKVNSLLKMHGIVGEYREWLISKVGVEEIDWYWNRGDTLARGVFLKKGEDAVAFRLRFEL